MILRSSLCMLLVLLATYGCAELTIDDLPADLVDTIEDTDNGTGSDVDTTPADVVETTDSDDVDDGETADFCPEDAEPCSAGETRCGPGGRSLQTCNQVCNAFLPESSNPCGSGELCYENELGAECTTPPFDECDPLAASADLCVSADSFAPCQRDGSLGDITTCSPSSRCADGTCRSPIVSTGTTCNSSGDCNDFCLCGSLDYNPRSAVRTECDAQPLLRGYCTVDNCLRDGCLDGEACALLSQTDFANGRDICLTADSCEGKAEGDSCSTSGRTGFTCRQVPVQADEGDEINWALACYDPLPTAVGETCSTSGQCLGSTCKRRSTASVCSQSCTSDSNCPGDSVCVYNPDEIDVNDSGSQSGLSSGLCLFRATACDGDSDTNSTLVTRITRTFSESASLLSVCYLGEQ